MCSAWWMNRFLREMNIPFSVIATKADKISRGARSKYLAPICRALSVQPWEIICFSGEDGTGRDDLLALLDGILHQVFLLNKPGAEGRAPCPVVVP